MDKHADEKPLSPAVIEAIQAFEAVVDHLPSSTVRLFGQNLNQAVNEVKTQGTVRLEREFGLAECRVIFQLAETCPLPPGHMALVDKLRNLVH